MARVGCEVAFRIGFTIIINKWIVKEFMMDPNHPLVDLIDTQFFCSHKAIRNPDKTQFHAMHRICVKTNQIMNYILQQSIKMT